MIVYEEAISSVCEEELFVEVVKWWWVWSCKLAKCVSCDDEGR